MVPMPDPHHVGTAATPNLSGVCKPLLGKQEVAGGSQAARSPSTSHLSRHWDVTSIFYLLSTPVSLLQDQQQPSSWLLRQERFLDMDGRWQDQQITQPQPQPAAHCSYEGHYGVPAQR